MSLKGNEGALGIDDAGQMNRILRHKLRNHSAGMKMTISKIQEVLEDVAPSLSDRCSLMIEELQGLEDFSFRMDCIFNELPPPESLDFFQLLTESRSFFAQKFSYCDLKMNGPQSVMTLDYGNWILIALKELLSNAGECVGDDCIVNFNWSVGDKLSFEISNSGDDIPENIPLNPPQAFFTNKGRHDGLGLSIVYRIVSVLGGTFNYTKEGDLNKVTFELALKETANV